MRRSGNSEPLKLHLGCGSVAPSEWTNIDYSWNAIVAKVPGARTMLQAVGAIPSSVAAVDWPRHVMIRDLRRRLPFDDSSAQHVYSSHCLEHLTRDDARRLLAECRRVLRPGGIIRLLVPDLLCLARTYVEQSSTRPGAAEQFLSDLTVFPAPEQHYGLRLYRRVHNAYHKWMYDEPLLSRALADAGFTSVRRRAFQESEIPDIGRVEPASHRFDKSLCLEARVPNGSAS